METPTHAEMDIAADAAREEIKQCPHWTVKQVAAWWAKWFNKCGHKRLGRILLKIDK
jgi:hypothetical protein